VLIRNRQAGQLDDRVYVQIVKQAKRLLVLSLKSEDLTKIVDETSGRDFLSVVRIVQRVFFKKRTMRILNENKGLIVIRCFIKAKEKRIKWMVKA
jgi:hypothetical protein